MFSCTIPIKPVPKGRPFFAKVGYKGRAITPAKTRIYEKSVAIFVAEAFKRAKLKRMTGALKIKLCFFLERAKSNKKKHPTQTPDLDNLVKAILDGLNASKIWDDDCQVVMIEAEKVWTYGLYPSTTLVIYELD